AQAAFALEEPGGSDRAHAQALSWRNPTEGPVTRAADRASPLARRNADAARAPLEFNDIRKIWCRGLVQISGRAFCASDRLAARSHFEQIFGGRFYSIEFCPPLLRKFAMRKSGWMIILATLVAAPAAAQTWERRPISPCT